MDGRHGLGYSIFALAVLAVVMLLFLNHVLLDGIDAVRLKQADVQRTIQSVRQRIGRWPTDSQDSALSESEIHRFRSLDATFRLRRADAETHKALYDLSIDSKRIQIELAERT